MGLNDLYLLVTSSSLSLTEDMERRLVDSLVAKLDDNNAEIKESNMKVLVELVNKIRFKSFNHLVTQLFKSIAKSSKQELKDISLVCLKGVIKQFNQMPLLDADWFIDSAIQLIQTDISIEALDVLGTFISKTSINDEQRLRIINEQFSIITSSNSRQAIKKKSIALLSSLLNQNHIDLLNAFIDSNLPSQFIITAHLLQHTLKLLNSSSHIDAIISHLSSEDDDIKDAALATLESYVTVINPQSHITALTEIAQSHINYNPNYFDVDEDEEEEEDEDEDDEEEEPLSDNDDLSWKVRKSAAKLLTAIIEHNPALLQHLYSTLFISLLNVTSKEREESVKLELFNSINAFFVVSAAVSQKMTLKRKRNDMDVDVGSGCDLQKDTFKAPLIKTLNKHLNEKSLIVRLNAYKLLTALVSTIPDVLQSPYIDEIAPHIEHGLNDVQSTISSGLPIEILTLLNTLFSTHTYRSIQSVIPALTNTLIATTKLTKYHKLSSLALKSLADLVVLLRPKKEDGRCSPAPTKQSEIDDLIKLINSSTIERITDSDLSNNVKDDAIALVAVLLSHSGDTLVQSGTDAQILKLLNDRITNNVNRLSGIKAVQSAAASFDTCTNLVFKEWFAECVRLTTPLIKQNDRVVKIASFECLEILLGRVGGNINKDVAATLIESVLPLINVNEMNTLTFALNIATKMYSTDNADIRAMVLKILTQSYSLTLSPVLITEPLEKFYQTVSKDGAVGDQIIKNLLHQISVIADKDMDDVGGEGEHVLNNASRLIGGVVLESRRGIEQFVSLLQSQNKQVSNIYLSLLVVGHVGQHADLSATHPRLFETVQEYFTHNEDSIRRASSYCLGNICVGSPSKFLPQLFHQLSSSTNYLILLSLKEVITNADLPGGDVDAIFSSLVSTASDDENIRNISAECLGKLLYRSEAYIPKIKQLLEGNVEAGKKVISILAIRFAISEVSHEQDGGIMQLDDLFSTFTALLSLGDLEITRLVLSTVNSAARHKAQLVNESIVANLLTQTTVNTALIRQITLGPFKETIDDGLAIRKTAYECLYTISNHCCELVSAADLLEQVKKGLADVDEIKILSYLILNRMVVVNEELVYESLDDILPYLQKTLQHKPKDNATKMEHERNTELQSSACRTLATLHGSSKTSQHTLLIDVIKTIVEPNTVFKNVFLSSSQLHMSTGGNNPDAMQID
ncbi:hypothetical protein E3P99_04057 [Wallemia hederae]|uniref:TATA-binding protein interacting (TIP20) domain-containing protein n=1 Tax=Wallemia hederae TaxID=1540922 RepID=A0A4T0FB04_9BASI|nr:hypothetical protein E3P99_04057 [Wallemia hederae]